MTSSHSHRGHRMVHDDQWRYADTMAPVRDDPNRTCGACRQHNRPDGHDACLGRIPNVVNACCGHGRVEEAYAQNRDGDIVRGRIALMVFGEHVRALLEELKEGA